VNLYLAGEFKVDDLPISRQGMFLQSAGGSQVRALWLFALSFALVALYACANISSLPELPRLSGLRKLLPHAAPETPQETASSEQARRLTPFAIAAGPDGNLWFTELRSSEIGRITPTAQISVFELGSGALAERLTAGPDAAIWFTDPAGNRVGRLGLDGTTTYVPMPTPESGPAAIVSAADGNLWFTEHAADKVARLTPLGTLTEFALPRRGGPAGIAEGNDRNLYVAENSGDRIDQISMDGRVHEFWLPTRGSRPDGVVRAADGSIWFTEFGSEKIGRLDWTGHIQEFNLAAPGPPLGIAADRYGDVWVTVPAAHAICKVALNGSQVAYHLPSRIWPAMIAVGIDGNLWFTEPSGMIGRLLPSGVVEQFSAVLTPQNAWGSQPERLPITAPW
jgi:virginiamycin B lyase